MLATTTVKVFRGTTSNDYGDETTTENIVASKVPFTFSESARQFIDADSGAPTTVVRIKGMARGTEIERGDLLEDEHTGQRYQVVQVSTPGPFIRGRWQALELRYDLA